MKEEILGIPNLLLSRIIGGIPLNHLTLFSGPPGSGKSTLSANLVAWIKEYLPESKILILDSERSLKVRLESFKIFDLVDYYLVPSSLEDALKIQLDIIMAKNGDKKSQKELEELSVPWDKELFIFWDTVTSSPLKKELVSLKQSLEDISARDFPIGIVAQVFSIFLRNVVPLLKNLTLIYVSQIRTKIAIGPFQKSGNEIPGGLALKHYASQIVEFSPAGLEEDGQWVKITLSKSKFFSPKKGEVFMSYSLGFDERVSVTRAVISSKVLGSGWIKVGEKSYQPKSLMKAVLEDPEVWKTLKAEIERIGLEKLLE